MGCWSRSLCHGRCFKTNRGCRYKGHRSQNFMSKQLTRQGPFWTITEVFEDQKSSRRLHQGHWSLSFMSQHSSRRLPLLIVRHTLPESGAASRGMRAGATTVRVSRGSLAPRSPASPCFLSFAITHPSLFCVAVRTGLQLQTFIQWFLVHCHSPPPSPTHLGRGQTQHLLPGQCRGQDNIWLANSQKLHQLFGTVAW